MELRLGTCSRRGRQCAIGRVKGTAAGALQFMCEHLERSTLCGPPPPRACRAVHSPIKGCHDRWQRGRRPGCYRAGFLAAAAAFRRRSNTAAPWPPITARVHWRCPTPELDSRNRTSYTSEAAGIDTSALCRSVTETNTLAIQYVQGRLQLGCQVISSAKCMGRNRTGARGQRGSHSAG